MPIHVLMPSVDVDDAQPLCCVVVVIDDDDVLVLY
jgi:hypothetical protein